ncbi:hypothetical protein FRC00_010498 [Tulasnella sp. 408]|nr:hypothetical protein FRC00_010498 [Tulasnella sp. 408]
MGSGSTTAETSTASSLPSPSFIGGFPTEVDYIPSIVLFFLFTFSLSPWIRRQYSSDVPALATIVAFVGGLLYVRPRLKYLDKPALDAIIKLSITLAATPTYRISVLHYTSPSLLIQPAPPYPPGSLTSASAKIIFYIFHAFPEVLVVYYIHCINIRAKFNTGPYGDWYQADAKYGIPQLREEGVIVQGVAWEAANGFAITVSLHVRTEAVKNQVGAIIVEGKAFANQVFACTSRDREKDEFDPERESLLTLVPTRSTASDQSEKTWW